MQTVLRTLKSKKIVAAGVAVGVLGAGGYYANYKHNEYLRQHYGRFTYLRDIIDRMEKSQDYSTTADYATWDPERKKFYTDVIKPTFCTKVLGLASSEQYRCNLNDKIMAEVVQAHLDNGNYGVAASAAFDAYTRAEQLK